jgi:uncharacterized protein
VNGQSTEGPEPGAVAAPPPFEPEPYRRPWWLWGPHAQTIGARLLRPGGGAGPSVYARERVDTPDGDFVDLDHFAGLSPDAPPVVVLHGLEGCSRSGYVLEACRALAARGLRGIALNFRSRSGEPNRKAGSYHAGATGDLSLVLERLKRRRPDLPLAAVGYSLGGNVLLKYLGDEGRRARRLVDAAVAVSVPFDLSRAADRMEAGLGRVYARFFLGSLREAACRKALRFPEAVDAEAARRARTIRAFDDAVTAPLHGFRDVAHYYEACSSGPTLGRVRVPTLVLHSRDDPLIPEDAIPYGTLAKNRWISHALPSSGGHVGFVTGANPLRPAFWAERQAAIFLASRLRKG